MSDTTITSANSTFTLMASSVFPVPISMEGYAVDKAFASDSVDVAETQMGVDGIMSAGLIFQPKKITVSLQANSPSNAFFTDLNQYQQTKRDISYITGVIYLPSIGARYTLNKGVLKSLPMFPTAQKVLQPMDYVLEFESIDKDLI